MPRLFNFDGRSQLFLASVVVLALTTYYLSGGTAINDIILLSCATQVITPGLVSVTSMFQHAAANYMLHYPLPIDVLATLMSEVDTRLGGPLNPSYVLLSSFLSIGFLHLPDIALGSLASDVIDIRPHGHTTKLVQLGPFGGAFDAEHYYTSGCRLLFERDVRESYLEVAYNVSEIETVIPRKPTLFYSRFKELGYRDNHREPRIHVRKNTAVALRLVKKPDEATLSVHCTERRIEDFEFFLTLTECKGGAGRPSSFGFRFSGPRVVKEERFFELWSGTVDVHYFTEKGWRRMRGSALRNAKPVALPRAENLFKEMMGCMLNAVSFHRPNVREAPTVPLRLAMSSVVRIAGMEADNGFGGGVGGKGEFVEATVRQVTISNLHHGVIIAAWVCYSLLMGSVILFKYSQRLVGPELGQWLALAAQNDFAKNLSPLPRFHAEQKERLLAEEHGVEKMSILARLVEAMRCDWVILKKSEDGLSLERVEKVEERDQS